MNLFKLMEVFVVMYVISLAVQMIKDRLGGKNP